MNAIFHQLQECIYQRYIEQTGKDLWQMYQLEPDVLSASPDLVVFAYTERAAIVSSLQTTTVRQALIRQCRNLTKAFTQQKNQFIIFSVQDDLALDRIYAGFLEKIARILNTTQSIVHLNALFQHVLHQHFLALREFTASFFDCNSAVPAEEQFVFQEPVCREYSNSLQLTMLGIDERQLNEPILDIGCGHHGRLVEYLRNKGYEAYGIDRTCRSSSYFKNADWLNMELQPDSWGTIMSHMAFSNHFQFHHLYKHGRPEQYAGKFMEILAALKPGGIFYYTPGLPFIETLLPSSQYNTCQKTSIHFSSTESIGPDVFGWAGLYTTAIKKIHKERITSKTST